MGEVFYVEDCYFVVKGFVQFLVVGVMWVFEGFKGLSFDLGGGYYLYDQWEFMFQVSVVCSLDDVCIYDCFVVVCGDVKVDVG